MPLIPLGDSKPGERRASSEGRVRPAGRDKRSLGAERGVGIPPSPYECR